MAKFDRSKFKTSKSLQDQEKELEGKIKTNYSSSGLPGWIEIKEDGEYLLRFWPTPVENSFFIIPTMVHYLTMELDKYEDGEVVKDENGFPVKEVRKGTVFNSRIHGNTEKDIVEEYISFVEGMASNMYGGDDKGKRMYLKHIYGYNKPDGSYVGGITGQLDYVGYASLMVKGSDGTYSEKEFGRVRLRPSIRKQMLTLSAGEDGDEGLVTDPFSDPDDGFIVKVIRDSVAGKKDPSLYYQVSWCTKNYVPVKYPLPEGFENRYEDMQTLPEVYENRYNANDFQNALDGLQRFDSESGYNAFSSDAWLDICEEISQYYPEEGENTQEPVKPIQKKEAPVKSEEVVEEETEETETEEVPQNELPFKKPETETLSAQDKLKAMKARLSKK